MLDHLLLRMVWCQLTRPMRSSSLLDGVLDPGEMSDINLLSQVIGLRRVDSRIATCRVCAIGKRVSQFFLEGKRARLSKRGFYAVAFASLLTINVCVFVHSDRPKPAEESAEPREPLFDGLGDCGKTVTSVSPIAQQYFSQGLAFLYNFNHEEADRSFAAAAQADPRCAMAFWGLAMANGPQINKTVLEPRQARTALQAATKARDLADPATAVERALIDAVCRRYADPPPKDRDQLDKAYADAMRHVRQAFPDDADVGALTAESLLIIHAWDWFTARGEPRPETREAIQTLKDVLRSSPRHAMALHMFIHAVEQGPHPEVAQDAAAALRGLTPGLEHLIHMPSHIDCRLGHWHDAVIANQKAIEADRKYRERCFWPRPYQLQEGHNHHSLVYAAMMDGESRVALGAARELVAHIPQGYLGRAGGLAELYFSMPYEVHLRFGDWEAMLSEPEPKKGLPLTATLRHYGRALAYASSHRLEQAKAEQRNFLAGRAAIPADAEMGSIQSATLLDIAQEMMAGEILYRDGQTAAGVQSLRRAISLEDTLPYAEPARWVLPVRHALGATLMDAGRYVEGEAVYRADLRRRPENGWSLHGLMRCLQMQRKTAEAITVETRFKAAWKYADFKISSSCCCLPGKLAECAD